MRLDKFLKVSRLVKRRTVANELCDSGNVAINGKTAKAANNVEAGQELTLRFGNRVLTVAVVTVPDKAVPAQQASSLFETISEHYTDKNQPGL